MDTKQQMKDKLKQTILEECGKEKTGHICMIIKKYLSDSNLKAVDLFKDFKNEKDYVAFVGGCMAFLLNIRDVENLVRYKKETFENMINQVKNYQYVILDEQVTYAHTWGGYHHYVMNQHTVMFFKDFEN